MADLKQFGGNHLVVGIPAGGKLTSVLWGVNLAQQSYPLNMAPDFGTLPEASEKEVGHARNIISAYALGTGSKYIWMLDDDVLPPPYAVQRLLDAMQGRPDVMACGGIYYSKQDVPGPVVFEDNRSGPYYDWKHGEVFEVPGFIGTGCLLIKTEVFDKITEPWFDTSDSERITDDAYFCRKVKAAGYKILGHGGVLCGHFNHRTRKTVWPPEVPIEQPALVQQ